MRNPAQLQRILAEAKRLEAEGPILATEVWTFRLPSRATSSFTIEAM